MSIENIIRAWKADEDDQDTHSTATNPVGEELTDQELQEVTGGKVCFDPFTGCFLTLR